MGEIALSAHDQTCSMCDVVISCFKARVNLLAHSEAERQRIENMRARGICFVHGGFPCCQ